MRAELFEQVEQRLVAPSTLCESSLNCSQQISSQKTFPNRKALGNCCISWALMHAPQSRPCSQRGSSLSSSLRCTERPAATWSSRQPRSMSGASAMPAT